MFDISFAELTLVFIIALVVLGPERLPKAARTVGHWMGRARAAFTHLKNELDREVVNKEMQDLFRQKADALRQETDKLNQSLNESLTDERKTETGSAPQPPAEPTDVPAFPATDDSRPQDKP